MTRSASSSVIKQQQNVSFGNNPIVKRHMKGIFENKPTLPKFQLTKNVLFTFCNMLEIQTLDIQELTQKMIMLMTLISEGQRAQTINSIRVPDIKILDNKIVLPIMPLVKKTKQTKPITRLCF